MKAFEFESTYLEQTMAVDWTAVRLEVTNINSSTKPPLRQLQPLVAQHLPGKRIHELRGYSVGFDIVPCYDDGKRK
jgi:hypothetical protein